MNLRQLVELTGIVSAHSPNLIEASKPVSWDAIRSYVHWSDVRIHNWLAALDELPRRLMETPVSLRPLVWQPAEGMLVDVLAGGLVTRVWGAVLTARDRSQRTCAAESVARSVLARQMRAQQGVLRMLVDGPHLTHERVAALDRLRRRIERWTDLLLGHLVRRYALADFAYNVERAFDFGDEQLRESWGARHTRIWEMYFLCLRSAFPDNRLPGGIQREWRKMLLQSILGSFPAEMFLDDGLLKSVRLQRILNAASREGPPPPGRYLRSRFGKWLLNRRIERESGHGASDE